jgi:hypothetical protein
VLEFRRPALECVEAAVGRDQRPARTRHRGLSVTRQQDRAQGCTGRKRNLPVHGLMRREYQDHRL